MSELLQRLEAWATETPSKTLLTFVDDNGKTTSSLTCSDLNKQVQTLAALLVTPASDHPKGLGLKQGDRVVLVYPPGLEFIVAFLACLRAGVVAVPVYPPDPRKMKKDINMFVAVVQNCQPSIALTTSTYYHVKQISAIKQKVSFSANLPWPEDLKWIVSDNLTSKSIDIAIPEVDTHNTAFLQYTSGSTSAPKGVVLSHANLNHNLKSITSALHAGRDTVVVSWLPQYHDMGLIGAYLGTIFNGGTGVYLSPFSFIKNPMLWIELISKHKATHLQAPNFAYHLCARKTANLRDKQIDLSSVRHMINGAEPIQKEAMSAFYKAFMPYGLPEDVIKPTYGLAEHTVYVCGGGKETLYVDPVTLETHNQIQEVNAPENGKEMVGCGVPSKKDHGIDVRIVNSEESVQVEDGHVGEVWISSDSVAQGYFGDEMKEISDQTFHAALSDSSDRFLRTGDLGVMYKNELFICGRMKDLVIIRGRNHYPQDLEATSENHEELRPGCTAAFSYSSPGDEDDSEKLAIVSELRDPSIQHKASLCGKIRSAISKEHGVQVTLIILVKPRTIPKTTSGKISRSRCKKAMMMKELDEIYRNEDMIGSFSEDDNDSGEQGGTEPPPAPTNPSMAHVISNASPDEVFNFLRSELAEQLQVEESNIRAETPLQQMGMDSMALTQLQGIINQKYQVQVPEEILYHENTTLASLHATLCGVESSYAGQTVEAGDMDPQPPKQKLFCGCIAC